MTTGLIDAHVHVWDPSRHAYSWLAGTPLNRGMLPADVDRAGGAVTGMGDSGRERAGNPL